MAQGCDTATTVTAARLTSIKNEGYTFIARYLNRVAGAHDELTKDEAKRISDAGLWNVSLHEAGSGNTASYFTAANGAAAAQEAIRLANAIGQPKGTPIYLCVDFDAVESVVKSNIQAYFASAKAYFSDVDTTSGYYMGIYGSKYVCVHIKGIYSRRYTFIAGASTGWWGNINSNFSNWNLYQLAGGLNITVGSGTGAIKIDKTNSNDNHQYGGGGWKI